MFKKINISKLIAAFFAVERGHALLRRWIPSYEQLTTDVVDKIYRKLRIRTTLLDEIKRYLGKYDLSVIKLQSKATQDYFLTFIAKECKFVKAYPLSKDFFTRMQIGHLTACDMEDVPKKGVDLEKTLLYTQMVGRTLEWLSDPVREDRDIVEFGKPQEGYWISSGVVFMTYKNIPIILWINSDTSVENENVTTNLDAYFLYPKKDSSATNSFIKEIKEALSKYNPYTTSVLACLTRDYNKINFKYDEQQTIDLRIKDYPLDLSFYNPEVKKAITTDLLPFVARNEKARRSYLLVGPPGCGKTQLIRHIISLLPIDYTIIVVDQDGIEALPLLNSYLGFIKPLCVIFEDIDLIIDDDSYRQQLLNFMDGISTRGQQLTIMTANKPSVLGHVFLRRPGRVDRVVKVMPGGLEERTKQLSFLLEDWTSSISVDILAEETEGFSFAQEHEFITRSKLYSGSPFKRLDKENTIAALDECREQFSAEITDHSSFDQPATSGSKNLLSRLKEQKDEK